ncbi:MAG: coiled-coil domain-containing protein [Promethearchaeota archaeon]
MTIEHKQITIGTQKYIIQDKVTLIIGKIKEDDLISLKDENLVDLITNLDPLPVENIIKNLESDYPVIKKSINLLKYLKDYLKSVELNADLITKYNELTQKIILSFQFIFLNNEKSQLNKELEIAKTYKQSSEIQAISDLLEKLNESLIHDKTNLNYLKQDYQKKKNQIDKINQEIQEANDILKNLTNKKKLCFRYINSITRNMDASSKNETEINSTLKLDPELTNAEKIRTLQIKAREIQHEINKQKLKIDETQLRCDNLSPQFKIISDDYEKLVHLIEEDENKVNRKENELKEMISSLDDNLNEQILKIDFRSIQTPSQIELALSDLELRMETILTNETFVHDNSLIKVEELIKDVNKLINYSKINKNKITISDADQKFANMFEGYFTLESIVNKLEETLNLLLSEINLRVNLEISITEGYTKLLIHPQFDRNKTHNIQFDDLTTPEKIFFIIIMQISIKMLQKSKTILFSNAFIPDSYNKRGSIFRTIRKLTQSFEINSYFKNHTFVFIISNLELKKQIENIKIIKIKDSD